MQEWASSSGLQTPIGLPRISLTSAPQGLQAPSTAVCQQGQRIAVFPTMRKKKRPAEAGRLVINR